MFSARIFGRFARFRRDEAGSATFEALIWIHVMLFFLLLILDATTIFMQNSKIQRIVQDGNRQYIKGVFAGDTNELEDWLEATLDPITPNAVATATVDGAGLLVTSVTYPTADTELSGVTNLVGITYVLDALQMTVRP